MSATLIPPTTPDRMQRKWPYGSGGRQNYIARSPGDAKPMFVASSRP